MRLLLTFFAISAVLLMNPNEKTFSVDLEAGEQIFVSNCAACHSGGNNIVVPAKTLKKDILSENKMNSVAAITIQVTNGKEGMPPFGGKLESDEIENVANYVLAQSESGW